MNKSAKKIFRRLRTRNTLYPYKPWSDCSFTNRNEKKIKESGDLLITFCWGVTDQWVMLMIAHMGQMIMELYSPRCITSAWDTAHLSWHYGHKCLRIGFRIRSNLWSAFSLLHRPAKLCYLQMWAQNGVSWRCGLNSVYLQVMEDIVSENCRLTKTYQNETKGCNMGILQATMSVVWFLVDCSFGPVLSNNALLGPHFNWTSVACI